MTGQESEGSTEAARYTTIDQPDAIDCSRHALIEASAGTGKTYTIEHLVLRLVRDEALPVDRILVVTFTEKAAGELRERIRARLTEEYVALSTPFAESASDLHAAERERLRVAVDGFDSAGVYTIHGFCHMVLSRFGFELGRPLRSEVVDDVPLIRTVLRRRMRGAWPAVYGDDLRELLEFSGFPEYDARLDESRWERRIRRVVTSAAGEPRTVPPAPESPEKLLAVFRELRSKTERLFEEFAALVGEIDPEDPGASEFARGFARLNQKSQSRDRKLNQYIIPFLRMIAAADSGDDFSAPVAAMHFLEMARRAKLDPEVGFRTLDQEHWLKNADDNVSAVCPRLPEVVDVLERLRALDFASLSQSLAAATIAGVADEITDYKNERAWVSFQDMLQLVNDALEAPNAPLSELLREQFACAIVDEFQDTDPVQWEIFRRLYLTDGARGVLYLVGDPKQAIYGFRGADVFAYFAARRELERLAGASRAALYRLSTNFRSTPELVRVFNGLFDTPAFFGARESSDALSPVHSMIGYSPAFEAPAALRKLHIAADETGRRALQLVRLDDAGSGTAAKRQYFRFLAREIHALVRSRKLRIAARGVERDLDFGDVCILLRTRGDAPLIEDALERLGVPHTFYKKTGLYQSREALELALLLRAVESPARLESGYKAALTRFFRLTPEEVDAVRRADQTPGQNDEPEFRSAISAWRELAEGRNWPAFFRSLLRTSLALTPPESDEDNSHTDAQYDRAVTNYEQICEELAENAVRENLDLIGIVEHLEYLRDEATPVREEWDVHRQESEDARVRLMTIHTSKGLEFPIVCLAGGFTRRMAHLYESFEYHDDKGERVHDLLLSNEERFRAEEEAEERRLYYVALTRAAVKLYVPYYRPADARAKHTAGPLARFVRDAIDAACIQGPGPGAVGGSTLFLNPEQAGEFFSDADRKATAGVAIETATSVPRNFDAETLFPSMPADVALRRRDLLSYTALSHRGDSRHAPGPADDGDERGTNASDSSRAETAHDDFSEESVRDRADAAGLSLEFEQTISPPGPELSPVARELDQRMRGADAGTMLHDMLEHLDYAGIDGDPRRLELSDANRRLILRLLRRNGLIPGGGEAAEDEIEREAVDFVGQLLRRVLTAPLPEAGAGFRLKDLAAGERIHELEFYFHVPQLRENSRAALSEGGAPRFQDGHVWGFIDLVFRAGGRYYLADWKSNLLDDYGTQALGVAMRDRQYDLQYRIYTYALVRWLRNQIPDFEYERDFGGVYYFFLRGMDPGAPGRGVYFARPAAVDDEQLMREIRERAS